jgi:hypothetical protein
MLDVKGEEKNGIAILKRALQEPLRQIVCNAGLEGSMVVNKVLEGKDDFGFNAADGHMKICWPQASSTPPKWCASHCRTHRPSPGSC